MKKEKLLLRVAVFAVAVLFLVACGNNDNNPTESVAVNPTDVADDLINESSEEVIYLDFWHAMTDVHREALNNVINAFHDEFPNIRIRHEYQGDYTDINQLVMASAMAGTLPHLVQQTTDNITEYIGDGIIIPLTTFFNETFSQDEISDIVEVFREGVIWDGAFMSVPFGKSTRVLFYNIDLFEAYGVEVPTTWDELIEVAQILTDVDANRFGMGFENGWGAEFIALTIQHGGAFIDETTATAHFGEQPGIDAAQVVMNMIDAGYARFAGEDNFLSGVFGNEFVAMYIGSSAGLPHVTRAVDGDFAWSTTALPTYNGNAASRFQGNDIVMMDNGMSEAEQRAAWEFMAFTMRPEVTAQWSAESGYIPISYSGRNHENWINYISANPHAVAATDQFDAGFMTARVPGANPVWQILVEELNMIRDGEDDIETALERAQARANEALKNE